MEVDTSLPEVKKDSQNVSAEEPLGSVTVYNTTEGNNEPKVQQIRSSARVFKKMKLDLAVLPPTPTPTNIVEKKEKKDENKADVRKSCRPFWNADDKTLFFEALNEYGKDFDSIQMYISNKLKKRGVPEHLIKTREQVRHLYYRTWHKISKYIKFSDEIKKVAQELYGLINYGELRKKVGMGMSSASFQKSCRLNELIYRGWTVVRVKGKNIRVKTPMCRALRKLNQLDENTYDDIKLPTRVTVELVPKDMASYLRVQSLAQNPKVRTILPLQKRLSSLILCFKKRWKSVDSKIYDSALISSHPLTNDCVPSKDESDAKRQIFSPELRITPPSNCRIELPSINLSEYFSRQSTCLTAYENRLGIKNFDYTSTYKSRKTSHRQRTSSTSSPAKTPSHTDQQNTEHETWNETETDTEVSKVVDDAVNTILALSSENNSKNDEKKCEVKEDSKEPDSDPLDVEKHAQIDKLKQGWIEKNSDSMTIGELYLMFGADSKLVLEYSWDNPEEKSQYKEECKSEGEDEDSKKDIDLGHALSKLLSLAKLHYRKNVIKCPCGHVCGMKSNVHLKQEMETKIRKVLTDNDKTNTTEDTDEKNTPEENQVDSRPTFVRPAAVYVQTSPVIRSTPAQVVTLTSQQLNAIRNMRPKYCNRKGRPRSKQVVVERKLPLLPNNIASGHQIVRMNIISQEEPVQPNVCVTSSSVEVNTSATASSSSEQALSSTSKETTTIRSEPMLISFTSSQDSNAFTPDFTINDDTIISTVPPSPSRILQEGADDQWINAEVADYSLSSLLGHLESPNKTPTLPNDDSRLSQDVDAQLQSLLTETSLDFAANFADLAAQVVNEIKK